MSQFLYKGKLSEVRVLSIQPFATTNEALASLDMQKIKLADGTTTVMPKAELDKCLSGEPDEVVVAETPVVVEEPVMAPEPVVEAPVEEVKEVSEAPVVSEPVAPVEPVIADQDAVAPQL